MNLQPLDVPLLLKRYGLRPQKSLGQNFLIDEGALSSVVGAGEPTASDTVLEVGPGLGSLTRILALHAGRVVAVELDEALLPPLAETLAGFDNVTVIQGDILALDIYAALDESAPTGLTEASQTPQYLAIANIPYYLTSALIRRLLEDRLPPRRMVLTIQREVAERICARSGKMSLMALSVQVYGNPEIYARIPSSAFYPPPQVESAVLRVDRYAESLIPAGLLPVFFRLAKAGFSQKRKTLRNSLSAGMHWRPAQAESMLKAAGITSNRRAETLSLEEWRALAQVVEDQLS